MSKAEAVQKLEFKDSQRLITCESLYCGWKNSGRSVIPGLKPDGMWYSVGDSWIQWCLSEEPDWIGKYIYEIEIDESKILKIDTLEKLDSFNSTYNFRQGIDWNIIYPKYFGLEIAPYFWERRLKYLWYYTWDVASGVVWNKDALRSRKLLYSYATSDDQYFPCLESRTKRIREKA